MKYAAVDFESYFDEECSITKLGVDGYILHPKFECYLATIVTDTGLEWVGHPSQAPWDKIDGDDWEWCAHNAGFDERVHYYLKKWGRIAAAKPRLWNCTADLCAFSAAPRALAAASEYLYQEKVSKDYRKLMKGKVFRDLSEDKQQQVRDAGLVDGRKCLRFWQDLSSEWPEDERRVSRISRAQAWHGLRVDRKALEQDVKLLNTLVWTAEQMIPWQGAARNLSYPALVAECQKVGIEAPPSVAMTSDECAAWEDKYGDKYPWIDAMRTARRANALLKKAQTMLVRVREEDGRMPYENKYFGAHTGRWGDGGETSGRYKSGGFNSRNLPRAEMFGEEYFLGKLRSDGTREEAQGKRFIEIWKPGMKGVNLRHRIIPAEGCHFPIADLRAIEPITLWEIAGDKVSLELASRGMHPYEVHARATMGYIDPESLEKKDPPKYQLSKARTIALGYQVGWVKFIMMAPTYISPTECDRIFSAPVSEEEVAAFCRYLQKVKVAEWNAMWGRGTEAERRMYVNSWLIVSDYRAKSPAITKLWRKMQRALVESIGDDLKVVLPSGRTLVYRKIARSDGEITGIVIKNGKPTRVKLYGGKLVENLIQAIARDVFVSCLLGLDDAGFWVAMHSHDEAVPEVPLSVTAQEVERIMSTAPRWMRGLPVASKCKSSMHYKK